MAWDTNIQNSKMVGKLPLIVLNQLRSALLERFNMWRLSKYPAPTFPAEIYEVNKYSIPNADWFDKFTSTLSDMITSYWDKYKTTPINDVDSLKYTTTSMLSYIDGDVYYPAPTSFYNISKWAYQQYQMLNLMTRCYVYTTGISTTSKEGYANDADPTTAKTLATTMYNDATWQDLAHYDNFQGWFSNQTNDASYHIIQMRQIFHTDTNYISNKCDIIVTLKTKKIPSNTPLYHNDFDDGGQNLIEDKVTTLFTLSDTLPNSGTIDTTIIYDLPAVPPTPPPSSTNPDDYDYQSSNGFDFDTYKVYSESQISGGFEYVDDNLPH